MAATLLAPESFVPAATGRTTMLAAVFEAPGRIVLDEKPIPVPGPGEALVKVTTTTICGTDVHILKGEYPVKPGLTVGHEHVGVVAALGPGVLGFDVGDRVIAGAITPCGHCEPCQEGQSSQCGGKAMGGWRFGNTIDGTQAEYVLVPDAMVNLARVPEGLTDEQAVLCCDIMSTGFAGAERGDIRIGDTVAVFATGPIGLCAVAGARLRGASRLVAVDHDPARLAMARAMGATDTIDASRLDPVAAIRELTEGRGVDVAIEALGLQQTFESCLRVLRPGGTLSSLGVYSGKLELPLDAFAAGLGDHRVVTALCPGGRARMRRLLATIATGRVDVSPLVTHRFPLSRILDAYDLFANRRDGVLKVAITP